MKHPVRRRLMYLGFQGLRGAAQWLPLGAAQGLGRGLGLAAYGLLGVQRRLALRHLEGAFGPALTPAQRRRVARGVFRNLGQNAMEWLALPRRSPERLQRLITADGVEHLRAALAQGRGVIGITAHFGNWELIPFYFASLGFEGGVLARRLRYPEYESFLVEMRQARGVRTYARGSLRDVAALLRANQIVGMLPDQDVDSLEGIFVEFFGRAAYTPIGPAALSIMTGAPIIPCFLIREGGPRHLWWRGGRFHLVVEPPLTAPQGADRPQAMAALTRAWSQVVESYIRRYPDHWVWMHRRWKTQPAEGVAGGEPARASGVQPVLAVCLTALSLALMGVLHGCGRPAKPAAAPAESPQADADQHMSAFTMTGYEPDGSKRWVLHGRGASAEGAAVTILQPDAVGYDPERTAYLTASAAQVNQTNRRIRMEHDVVLHTSDGLWLTTPLLHWLPDQNEMATDSPVRIETDHMLIRGRGLVGHSQLKRATIARDIELVLNPSDHEAGPAASLAGGDARRQVLITCDGPLTFDYEQDIATFEQNVHVQDPNGDLYSDRLIAYLDRKTHTIRYAEAIGQVRIQQQQNTAESERAVYEPAIGKITLVGRPSLLLHPSEEDGVGGTPFAFSGLSAQQDQQVSAAAP
ncbi:MAG: LPS export ABC transporter periplasmic protein LptC [Candidatus Omnitrophica bacterium]|nr:LPS export ABC transporter periplasmic protein LptC [Candidatus Omnitrophota bacterium]